MFNVATCAAAYDAVYRGMPLVKRVLTVTGRAVTRPSNFSAPIGTLYADLIEAAGGFCCEPYKIFCGGPMMGIAQHTLDCGTIKGNNAVTCYSRKDNHEVAHPHCIRCGKCLDACPMHLMPLQLGKRLGKVIIGLVDGGLLLLALDGLRMHDGLPLHETAQRLADGGIVGDFLRDDIGGAGQCVGGRFHALFRADIRLCQLLRLGQIACL